MNQLPGSTHEVLASDGASLAVRSWDGTTPGLLFVHATGFSKELWAPVVAAIRAGGVDASGLAFDQRGHGDSAPIAIPMDWALIGSDVAQVVGQDRRPTIGVGHSSGGAALAIAAVADPDAFDHLILIEPIIKPPPYERHEEDPMAAVAEGRRSSFPDRESARQHFNSKGAFAHWIDGAMDAYVEHGLRDTGDGVVVKCSPATEAEHYRSGWAHSTWDRLGEISAPVTLIVGSESTTHRGSYLGQLAARFSEVDLHVVPGASHFVPMERPELVADLIGDLRVQG